jgi:hypothetical protein
MQKIVLLYNDRDRPTVNDIRLELEKRCPQASVWMASEDLTAFGDIFQQIETAIEGASGIALFLGRHGLGRFQERIELVAVSIERWQQGSSYGCLLVHLEPGVEVPRRLLGFATVNHDGTLTGAKALAAAIAQRFRCAPSPLVSST